MMSLVVEWFYDRLPTITAGCMMDRVGECRRDVRHRDFAQTPLTPAPQWCVSIH
jgi:hypothetical protein